MDLFWLRSVLPAALAGSDGPSIQTRIAREIAPLSARGPHAEAIQGPRQVAGTLERGSGDPGEGQAAAVTSRFRAAAQPGARWGDRWTRRAGTGFPGKPSGVAVI